MYFKIQGTYFKISALYFSPFQMAEKQQYAKAVSTPLKIPYIGMLCKLIYRIFAKITPCGSIGSVIYYKTMQFKQKNKRLHSDVVVMRKRAKGFVFMMRYISFKRCLAVVVVVGLCSAGCSFVRAQDVETVVGNALPRAVEGLSAEYDPHFLVQNMGVTPDIKPGDWENVVLRRIRLLKLQRLRIMVLPSWYEPQNDNDDPMIVNDAGFNFRSPEFEALEKLLDFCMKEDIRVTLVFWGVNPNTFMLPVNEPGWIFGPAKYDEWAENVSRCIKHLVVEKKYTCIEAFTPVNEPDWAWVPTSTPNLEKYVAMCRVLQKRLEDDGLRRLIRLNLSDNSDGGSGTHYFLEGCGSKLSGEADFFNSHTYVFGYETPDSIIYNWERENVKISGNKPHFVGEFGSNQTVGATRQRDINLFERGVLLGRIVINCMNAGASGLSYWALLDQYYSKGEVEGKQYGQMQQLGLWKYVKSAYEGDSAYADMKCNYEPRPQYYAYGLLTRFVRRGDRVFKTAAKGNGAIPVLVLKSAKGEWTYVVANAAGRDLEWKVENPQGKSRKSFAVYGYLKGSLPKDDGMIPASGVLKPQRIRGGGHSVAVKIPANSLVVLSQRQVK